MGVRLLQLTPASRHAVVVTRRLAVPGATLVLARWWVARIAGPLGHATVILLETWEQVRIAVQRESPRERSSTGRGSTRVA